MSWKDGVCLLCEQSRAVFFRTLIKTPSLVLSLTFSRALLSIQRATLQGWGVCDLWLCLQVSVRLFQSLEGVALSYTGEGRGELVGLSLHSGGFPNWRWNGHIPSNGFWPTRKVLILDLTSCVGSVSWCVVCFWVGGGMDSSSSILMLQ